MDFKYTKIYVTKDMISPILWKYRPEKRDENTEKFMKHPLYKELNSNVGEYIETFVYTSGADKKNLKETVYPILKIMVKEVLGRDFSENVLKKSPEYNQSYDLIFDLFVEKINNRIPDYDNILSKSQVDISEKVRVAKEKMKTEPEKKEKITEMTEEQVESVVVEKDVSQLYLAPRDNTFKDFIVEFLRKIPLSEQYYTVLTSPEAMENFGWAFDDPSVSNIHNYNQFKQFGLLSLKQSFLYYLFKHYYTRFSSAKGADKMTKIYNNLEIDHYYAKVAQQLGFWNFVSRDKIRNKDEIRILKNVFLAFFGVIEKMIDKYIRLTVGYGVVRLYADYIYGFYHFDIEGKKDTITLLKELFDTKIYGTISYKIDVIDDVFNAEAVWKQTDRFGGKEVSIGRGSGMDKPDAERDAAGKALEYLESIGIKKRE